MRTSKLLSYSFPQTSHFGISFLYVLFRGRQAMRPLHIPGGRTRSLCSWVPLRRRCRLGPLAFPGSNRRSSDYSPLPRRCSLRVHIALGSPPMVDRHRVLLQSYSTEEPNPGRAPRSFRLKIRRSTRRGLLRKKYPCHPGFRCLRLPGRRIGGDHSAELPQPHAGAGLRRHCILFGAPRRVLDGAARQV
jgi:hypothetical protein